MELEVAFIGCGSHSVVVVGHGQHAPLWFDTGESTWSPACRVVYTGSLMFFLPMHVNN